MSSNAAASLTVSSWHLLLKHWICLLEVWLSSLSFARSLFIFSQIALFFWLDPSLGKLPSALKSSSLHTAAAALATWSTFLCRAMND